MAARIIKAYMALKGISQRELASLVGIEKTTLNYKINGKVAFKANEMSIISKILGVGVEELFFTDSISTLKIQEGEDGR